VVRGEVKEAVDPLAGAVGELPVLEVALVDLDLVGHGREVLAGSTGEVVGDAHVGASVDEFLDEVTTDERGAAGDEDRIVLVAHRDPSSTAGWSASSSSAAHA